MYLQLFTYICIRQVMCMLARTTRVGDVCVRKQMWCLFVMVGLIWTAQRPELIRSELDCYI
jgi:hypothetical protein